MSSLDVTMDIKGREKEALASNTIKVIQESMKNGHGLLSACNRVLNDTPDQGLTRTHVMSHVSLTVN